MSNGYNITSYVRASCSS